MTPDHVRGRLSSDAGVTSSSIISPTIPSPISTLSTAPFMMLSPASTTSDNLIHRRFPYGLLRQAGAGHQDLKRNLRNASARVFGYDQSGRVLMNQRAEDGGPIMVAEKGASTPWGQ